MIRVKYLFNYELQILYKVDSNVVFQQEREQMNCKGKIEKLNKSEIKEVASEVSVRLFFDWLTI